jgi:hypothetical protein
MLSQVLLREHRDLPAAEKALRDVLALAPTTRRRGTTWPSSCAARPRPGIRADPAVSRPQTGG